MISGFEVIEILPGDTPSLSRLLTYPLDVLLTLANSLCF